MLRSQGQNFTVHQILEVRQGREATACCMPCHATYRAFQAMRAWRVWWSERVHRGGGCVNCAAVGLLQFQHVAHCPHTCATHHCCTHTHSLAPPGTLSPPPPRPVQAAEFLSGEGHLYSTTDDRTFKTTGSCQ